VKPTALTSRCSLERTSGVDKIKVEQVRLPEPDAWKSLARDLKLTAVQIKELKFVVWHAVKDIEDYLSLRSKIPARSRLTAGLMRMEKAISNLQYEIDRSIHLMNHFLPHDTLAGIGRSFTFSAIGKALGKDVFPRHLDWLIGRMVSDRQQITMAALEEKGLPQRESLGLNHGHQILKYFIDTINEPVKKWVEIDRTNKGGRPPEMARRYLISRLAHAAPGIIGKRATIATTGPFVELCSSVLLACGLSAKGIEKAIPPIVKKLRSDQAKQRR